MKIYILWYSFWDERSYVGVYSTEDKAAKALLLDAKGTCSNPQNYHIEETELE
jgi:hypothetical protein